MNPLQKAIWDLSKSYLPGKKSVQAEYFQTGKKMLARPFSCENGDISVAGI